MHHNNADVLRYVKGLFRSGCHFSNLSLQKRYFHKFYYFSDHVYFQLPWFLKRAVAEALKLQKMTVTFRHISFTCQIFNTGFKGDVFYL